MRFSDYRNTLAAFLWVVLTATWARADVLVTNFGQTYVGQVTHDPATKSYTLIEADGGRVTFPETVVLEVRVEAAEQTKSAPPPSPAIAPATRPVPPEQSDSNSNAASPSQHPPPSPNGDLQQSSSAVSSQDIAARRQQLLTSVENKIEAVQHLWESLPPSSKTPESDLGQRLANLQAERERIIAIPEAEIAAQITAERQKVAAIAEHQRQKAEEAQQKAYNDKMVAQIQAQQAQQAQAQAPPPNPPPAAQQQDDDSPLGIANTVCKILEQNGTIRSAQFLNVYFSGPGQWRHLPSDIDDVGLSIRFTFVTQAGLTRENDGYIMFHGDRNDPYNANRKHWRPYIINIDGINDIPAAQLLK